MTWNQPKCEACWIRDNTVEEVVAGLDTISIRRPVTLTEPELEQCAWCGSLTIVGIYVRFDPRKLPYGKVNG